MTESEINEIQNAMSDCRVIKYDNAVIVRTKNKKVMAYRTEQGSCVLFVNRIIKDPSELSCVLSRTYRGKVLSDTMYLKNDTLIQMLYCISELLKNELQDDTKRD